MERIDFIIAIVGIILTIVVIGGFAWVNARRIGKVESKAEETAKRVDIVCTTIADMEKLRITLAEVNATLGFFRIELERGHDKFLSITCQIESAVREIGEVSERLVKLEALSERRS